MASRTETSVERLLGKSTSILMKTLDNLQDGVFVLDSNWNFTYLNKKAAGTAGLKPQDIVGRNLWKDFPQVKGTVLEENYLEALRSQKVRHFEALGPGTAIFFDITVYPSKEGIVVHWQDITDRKKAEEAAKRSNDRVKEILNSIHDSIYALDQNWNIVYTNNSAIMDQGAKAAGLANAQDLVGKNWLKIFHGYQGTVFLENLKTAMEEKKGCMFEYFGEYSKRWAEVAIYPSAEGIVVTGKDITERKKAEERLSVTKDRLVVEVNGISKLHELSMRLVEKEDFQGLLDEFVNAAIKLMHADMGNMQLIDEKGNLKIVAQVGFKQPFLDFFNCVSPESHAACGVAKASRKRVIVEDVTINPIFLGTPALKVQLDAGVRALQSTPLFTRSGEMIGVISTHYKTPCNPDPYDLQLLDLLCRQAADLIQHKKAEEALKESRDAAVDYIEELKELQAKLEIKTSEVKNYATKMEALAQERAKKLQDAERLSAIGATAGMVGHDIRNPLQSITGELYLLNDNLANLPDSNEKSEMKESTDSITANIFYINKIVADLQDYARPLSPEYSTISLSSVLVKIFENIGVPESIKLSMKVKDLEKLRTDPILLQRALSNLVTNAIQAMLQGGILEITGHPEENKAIITVSDTGVGIPDEIKQRLFTPMMTTKSKGQGFGLAVSKRLIEAMNGAISFESEKGKGTKFTITLPIKD